MDAALEGDESDYDQNEHDDEHHALFVLGKLENSEQAFHLALQSAVGVSNTVSVMLSEAKHLCLALAPAD